MGNEGCAILVLAPLSFKNINPFVMAVTVLHFARVNLPHLGCPLFYFKVGCSVPLFCVLLSFLYLMKGGVVMLCHFVPQKKNCLSHFNYVAKTSSVYFGATVQVYNSTMI